MRSLFRPLAVLAMTGGLVMASAVPAWAHHPDLSGVVACTSGQQVITWTVKNSETATGSNRTMTVDQLSVSSGTMVGLAVGAVFPPQPKTGSVQTATTTLSGTKTGSVTLTVRGDWNLGGPQDVVRTVTVTLPGGCTVPVTTSSTTTTTTTTAPPTTTTTTAPPTTTTTAAPTTTTTAAPTTTTTAAPTTTSTTAPPTTTTTGPGSTTTTTVAPTTTSTVRTEVLGQTEMAPTTTTTVKTDVLAEHVTKPAPSGALPHTGVAIGLLAFVGGGLLWIGLPLSRYKRRQNQE